MGFLRPIHHHIWNLHIHFLGEPSLIFLPFLIAPKTWVWGSTLCGVTASGAGAVKVPGLGEVPPPGEGGELPRHVAWVDLLALLDLGQGNQKKIVVRVNHSAYIGPDYPLMSWHYQDLEQWLTCRHGLPWHRKDTVPVPFQTLALTTEGWWSWSSKCLSLS